MKAGIVPDYVTCVDGSDVCTKWYDGLLSEQLEVRDQSGVRYWYGRNPGGEEYAHKVPVRTKAVLATFGLQAGLTLF